MDINDGNSPLDALIRNIMKHNTIWEVLTVALWVVIGAAIIGYFTILPKYRYSHASVSEKCQLDLKKLNDSDKYCDNTNKINSRKAVSEAAAAQKEAVRKASLTPKQRCQEEKKGFQDPDTGEYIAVSCRDDGTADYTSTSEMMDEYYSEMQYDDSGITSSGCNPNYTPCISNGGDLDCPDIGFTVRVIGADVYRLDRDGDGYGCEPY